MRSQLSFLHFSQRYGLVLLLVAFAFGMSALVSRTVFERLPHLEDEVAYLFQARIFARGEVVIDTPDPRNAFWQPFVVDSRETGHRFGKYTPGWPLLLSLGVRMGQVWLVNALLSALTVALVYRIGREIYAHEVGVLAALLTAFSPAALLLNSSLMGHTAALFYATLFIYAYWRLEHGRRRLTWGLVAGAALGLLAMTRPLTTLAIALPFVIWSGLRLAERLLSAMRQRGQWQHFWRNLAPLLLLSGVALSLVTTLPAFNYAATGDASQNLYELVWSYDKVGFGDCCGRSGHTLEKAFRHTRFDLSLTAADLFGWQLAPITPQLQEHLRTSASYWPEIGLSFVLLPVGILLGILAVFSAKPPSGRWLRLIALLAWSGVALAWVLLPINIEADLVQNTLGLNPDWITEPSSGWLWTGLALLWLSAPMVLWLRWRETPQIPYTWLLASVVLGIVLVQMLYWIGSQRYSTRYYFEALQAAALLSALPLGWLARRVSRPLVYSVICLLAIGTLYHYSTPRIAALYQFNFITQEHVDAIDAQRDRDQDILVIVTGSSSGDDRVRWRAYGTWMAVTSPFLDSEIVVARDFGSDGFRERILATVGADRQIIEVLAVGNDWSFVE